MISILIAIICAGIIGAFLLAYSLDNYNGIGFLSNIFGFLLSVASAISFIIYAFSAWSWFAAEHKANIINSEYGTKYTQSDIFWASDVIDTIRQIDRKRIEVNGDIMRDKADEK